jgi:hypothetical protein
MKTKTKPKRKYGNGIQLDAAAPMLSFSGATRDSIEAAKEALLEILECPAGDSTKLAALEALTKALGAPQNVSIHGCTFTG